MFKAISFVWDIFALIAVPTVLLALLGRWLDTRWHTSTWLTLTGLALALVASSILVSRKARTFSELIKKV